MISFFIGQDKTGGGAWRSRGLELAESVTTPVHNLFLFLSRNGSRLRNLFEDFLWMEGIGPAHTSRVNTAYIPIILSNILSATKTLHLSSPPHLIAGSDTPEIHIVNYLHASD